LSLKVSASYGYTIGSFGYPTTHDKVVQAIKELSSLGYDALELEGLGIEHMREVHSTRKELKAICDDCGVRVHNFCAVDPGLVSTDRELRKKTMEVAKIGAEVAAFFEADTLHLASYAPPLHFQKIPYELGKKYTFDLNYHVSIPDDFDYKRVWEALVDSSQQIADIARPYNLGVIMEPRVGELICSSDSMLRLLDDVDRPNFHANFDVAHFQAQKEYVVLALEKLKGRYANIHIADNDGRTIEHLPLGEGIVDWTEFFRVLDKQGYQGYLGVDIFLPRSKMKKAYKDALHFLKQFGVQS
jgi:sugar phosphate isomerase/epimerase